MTVSPQALWQEIEKLKRRLASMSVTGATKTYVDDAIGTGTVTATGSPANGNLTKFSGADSVTNGDLSGDVTTSGTLATTIANDAVSNAKLADMTEATVKMRAAGAGTGNPIDGDADQLSTLLDAASDPFVRTSAAGSSSGGSNGIAPFTVPDNSQFAWVNQNGATVSVLGDGIYLSNAGASGSYDVNLRKKPVTFPGTVTMCFYPDLLGETELHCGLMLRESGTSKLLQLGLDYAGAAGFLRFRTYGWTNPTTYGGYSTFNQGWPVRSDMDASPLWFQFEVDASNIYWRYSLDGFVFRQLASASKSAFFTTGPDEAGFFVNRITSASRVGIRVVSWEEV